MDDNFAAVLAAGLHLVAIPNVNGQPVKAPQGISAIGWNKLKSPSNPNGYSNNPDDFKNCDDCNFGLAHLPSRTMALDIDDLNRCLALFDDVGLPLTDWLKDPSALRVQSGKANRDKLIYRLPVGVDSFITRQFSIDKVMLFELRNSSRQGTTLQDVILGKHPEMLSDYKIIGDINNIPEMPPELLSVALHWDDWRVCFDSALGIAEHPKIPLKKPLDGEDLAGFRNPIAEFNQSNTVREVLLRNGYKYVGKDRFIRPDSTSKAPAVVILNNCSDGVERVFSFGGDDLNDGYAHDAFDCFRLLECGGNW